METRTNRGQAFPKVMPMYSKEVITDQQVEFIWHYLRTLSPADQAGPPVVKLKKDKNTQPKSLLDVRNEVVVTDEPKSFEAPLEEIKRKNFFMGYSME